MARLSCSSHNRTALCLVFVLLVQLPPVYTWQRGHGQSRSQGHSALGVIHPVSREQGKSIDFKSRGAMAVSEPADAMQYAKSLMFRQAFEDELSNRISQLPLLFRNSRLPNFGVEDLSSDVWAHATRHPHRHVGSVGHIHPHPHSHYVTVYGPSSLYPTLVNRRNHPDPFDLGQDDEVVNNIINQSDQEKGMEVDSHVPPKLGRKKFGFKSRGGNIFQGLGSEIFTGLGDKIFTNRGGTKGKHHQDKPNPSSSQGSQIIGLSSSSPGLASGGFDLYSGFSSLSTDTGFGKPVQFDKPVERESFGTFGDFQEPSDQNPSGFGDFGGFGGNPVDTGVDGVGWKDSGMNGEVEHGGENDGDSRSIGLISSHADRSTDDKDCETILTKSCTNDTECSCYGFYHCKESRCREISSSTEVEQTDGIWHNGPAETLGQTGGR